MHLFISNTLDPYINLATEEYLLKNSSNDIIFLYRNRTSVVVGKHQNAMAEVNYRFVNENNIPVVRRISGGGTVYHDEGNINFTFLQNGEEGNLVNFRSFIAPVAEFLKLYSIPAEIGPRNDILVHGLKVSGNAEHIFRKRTLHHGTLLFSSALTDLRNTLHVEAGKYTDRAVKSVRSKVTNIKEHLIQEMDTLQFFDALAGYLLNHYHATPLNLTDTAFQEINGSATAKYMDWNWNYGYSPNYSFKNKYISDVYQLEIELEVEKGNIKTAKLAGNIGKELHENLNHSLIEQRHSYSDLQTNQYITELQTLNTEILWYFF